MPAESAPYKSPGILVCAWLPSWHWLLAQYPCSETLPSCLPSPCIPGGKAEPPSLAHTQMYNVLEPSPAIFPGAIRKFLFARMSPQGPFGLVLSVPDCPGVPVWENWASLGVQSAEVAPPWAGGDGWWARMCQGLMGNQLERDLLGDPKGCGSAGAVEVEGRGTEGAQGGCASPVCPPLLCLWLPGSQELQRAIGRNHIRKEKLVLQVFPAGGGEEPSQWLQGYLQNSVPQKQPILPHGNPMARRSCKGGRQQLARHCP